jgi:hypothetical protein
MTEPKPEKRGKGVGFYAVIVLGALVLYVLSVGPAWWLVKREYLDGNTYAVVYTPLWSVAHRSERLEKTLFWYGVQWEPAKEKKRSTRR